MKAAMIAAAGLAAFLLLLIWIVPRMHYNTREEFAPPQPVPFSHAHHVGALGLDCRYCHTAVEVSANAGMPPTETCMTCHSQIWTHAEVLHPVRRSFAERKPLRWTRVYTEPDYVFFNHSIHVAKGVGCTECHGRVDRMPLMRRVKKLQMIDCLECHRDPTPHLRPRDQVFNMAWHPTSETPSGEALMAAYKIHPETLTDCGVCHR